MTVISLLICLGAGFAILGAVILGTLHRRRMGNYTVQDSLHAMERITAALSELPRLPARERTGKRRAIAKDILRDTGFLVSLVDGYRNDENPEIRDRAWSMLRETMQLSWEMRKLLFLLTFRPKLVADCQRVFYAAMEHCLLWIAYLRLLKARYPERYGGISEPELL